MTHLGREPKTYNVRGRHSNHYAFPKQYMSEKFGLVWFGLIHYSAFSAAKAM